MADVAVVSSGVREVSDIIADTSHGAGTIILAGSATYLNSADSLWYPAASTNATTAGSGGIGIATTSALGSGQKIRVVTGGTIYLGVALTVGSLYGLSSNAGRIAPVADLPTGGYRTFFGWGVTGGYLTSPSGGYEASGEAQA